MYDTVAAPSQIKNLKSASRCPVLEAGGHIGGRVRLVPDKNIDFT